MAKPITEADYDVAQVVDRIRHAKDRIVQAVKWARSTQKVWMAFNDARFPRDLSGTRVEEAAVVYQPIQRAAEQCAGFRNIFAKRVVSMQSDFA